jgi:hypothetical protein
LFWITRIGASLICGVMRSSRSIAPFRSFSVLLALLAIAGLGLLAANCDLLLLVTIGPFVFASLSLAWRAWRPFPLPQHALALWALSVPWAGLVVYIAFKPIGVMCSLIGEVMVC